MAARANLTGSGSGERSERNQIPQWAFDYQGHKCMCMPVGYRAGLFALKRLGVEREKDYGAFLFSESGDEDGSGCFDDGLQAATGCTTGKSLFFRLHYGKLSVTLFKPGRGAVRVHVKNDYLERLMARGSGFIEQRKRWLMPSQLAQEVIDPIIESIESSTDEEMFEYEELPSFVYKPVKKSLGRKKCVRCGVYTIEADGKVAGENFFCKTSYLD